MLGMKRKERQRKGREDVFFPPRARRRAGLETADPGRRRLSGSPLWVGGELLSHGLPQYHRRGGA